MGKESKDAVYDFSASNMMKAGSGDRQEFGHFSEDGLEYVVDTADNRNGWDGNWYVYAFDDDGVLVGSESNPEGKIHLNAQTFALLTGIAEGERVQTRLSKR